MKVKIGEREVELHPLIDVPRVGAAGALAVMRMGEAVTMKTARGEQITLRFAEWEGVLQQVLDAA